MSKPPTAEQQDGSLSRDQMRDKIDFLEKELLKQKQHTAALEQHFIDGVYGREMFLPAGVYLTGAIHRKGCINIILQGELEIADITGTRTVKAPAVFTSPGGVKRAARIIHDTIWLTVHANPDNIERDCFAMADLLTAPTYDDLEPTGAMAVDVETHCQE